MALDAQYHAPGSMAAVYRPGGGAPLANPIRVIRSQEDQELGFSEAPTVARAYSFLFRRSEVPNPLDGDVIEITAGHFRLVGEPRIDVEDMEWTCAAEMIEL